MDKKDEIQKNVEVVSTSKVFDKEFIIYGTVEEPLFLAKDVAEWIEYDVAQVGKMIQSVDDDEKLPVKLLRAGQMREMWFLTEDGLYEVLMQSRKPIAKQFKKEVKKLLKALRLNKVEITPALSDWERNVKSRESMARLKEAEAEEKRMKLEMANYWLKLSDRYSDNTTYRQILDAHSTYEVAGEYVLPLPALEEKNYSATEVGKLLGVSANKIGSLANKLNLKTEEYGKWYVDKSRYSNKEVNTFRYNQKAIETLREVITEEK